MQRLDLPVDLWKISVSASKRNVFFSVSDPLNKVRKLVTPGIFLKPGITREDYNRLDDRKSRRKKRSLRLFTNNHKRAPSASAKAWSLIYSYLVENKLLAKNFLLIFHGPSVKRGRMLMRNLLKQADKIRFAYVIVKDFTPHNGCPAKIKKRKKNKGKNRISKSISSRLHKLPTAPGVEKSTVGVVFDMPLQRKITTSVFQKYGNQLARIRRKRLAYSGHFKKLGNLKNNPAWLRSFRKLQKKV